MVFSDPASVAKVLQVRDHVIDNKKVDPKQATVKAATQVREMWYEAGLRFTSVVIRLGIHRASKCKEGVHRWCCSDDDRRRRQGIFHAVWHSKLCSSGLSILSL